MSEINFGANQTQVAEAPVNPKAQPTPEMSVPATTTRSGGLMLGDHIPTFAEIIFPRVNLSQAIGDLKDAFPPGSIVFDRRLPLFTPAIMAAKKEIEPASEPATMIVVGFRPTRFAEKVSGGVRGMIVNTEDEVLANGGTLNYKEWELKSKSGMKLFQHLADALVLIERPSTVKNDGAVFGFEIGDKQYTLALWGMKGSAYTAGAKVLFTKRSMGSLRKGYPSFVFSVSSVFKQWPGGKEAWVPVFTEKEKTSPEVLQFLADFISGNGGSVDAAAAANVAADAGE